MENNKATWLDSITAAIETANETLVKEVNMLEGVLDRLNGGSEVDRVPMEDSNKVPNKMRRLEAAIQYYVQLTDKLHVNVKQIEDLI